jgi:hypothetical protein
MIDSILLIKINKSELDLSNLIIEAIHATSGKKITFEIFDKTFDEEEGEEVYLMRQKQ